MQDTLASPPRARRSPSLWSRVWRARGAYLFLIPTFVFLGYFLYYPAGFALFGAFTRWDGFSAPQFVGLENFRRAFADPVVHEALGNNALWLLADLFLALVPSLIAAELIFHLLGRRRQYFWRTLFVVPLVVPGVVTLLLWQEFYRSDGIVNQALGALGLGRMGTVWLGDPDRALPALMFMGFPWINVFNLLIFYSGLQGIGHDVFEAAKIDGATGLRRIRTIDLPLLTPQIRILVILTVIGSVQTFLASQVMTGGGPGYSTYTYMLHTFQTATRNGEFGYSMALSFMLFVVVLLLTGLSRLVGRERGAR